MKFGIAQLLFVSLILGLLASSYLFAFKPATEKRTARQTEIAGKRKALADLRQSTSGINDLERKITELQQAIKFFESKLPQQREIDKVLSDVAKRAEQQHLQMQTFKTMKIEKSSGYSELPIKMSMSGDFNSFYAFLLDLETLTRLTRLNQMKLEKITNREGEMTAQLTLSIFFESGNAPDAGVAGAR
jgi:type IV pilus assembly protein PilO